MFESTRGAGTMTGDLVAAAGKSAPPIAVSGLTVAGVSLQDWVLILTAIYTVIQIALLTPKVVAFVKGLRGG